MKLTKLLFKTAIILFLLAGGWFPETINKIYFMLCSTFFLIALIYVEIV